MSELLTLKDVNNVSFSRMHEMVWLIDELLGCSNYNFKYSMNLKVWREEYFPKYWNYTDA